jgi:hypothetical protein
MPAIPKLPSSSTIMEMLSKTIRPKIDSYSEPLLGGATKAIEDKFVGRPHIDASSIRQATSSLGKKLSIQEKMAAFVQSPEGLRRATLTQPQVHAELHPVLNEAFDDLGIPPELRPEFTVLDELRHHSPEELTKRIATSAHEKIKYYGPDRGIHDWDNVEVPPFQLFKTGETPQQFSNEDLLARMKSTLGSVLDEAGVPTDKQHLDWEDYTLQDTNFLGANYHSTDHRIRFHANTHRQGVFTPEESLAHEAKHAEQALLRSQLPLTERSTIIQQHLLDQVRNGETEKIIKGGNLLGLQTMTPPRLPADMKADFIDLLEQKVYPQANAIVRALVGIDAAKDATVMAPLKAAVGQLVEKYPTFQQQYEGNVEKATQALLDYSQAQASRLHLFTQEELKDEVLLARVKALPLTNEKHNEAVQSLRDTVATHDGNTRTQGFVSRIIGDKAAFDQYQFSPEEVLARNYAAEFEQKKLLANHGGSLEAAQSKPEVAQRLQELDLELKRNTLGSAMYKAYNQHIQAPLDTQRLQAFQSLKQDYETLINPPQPKVKKGGFISWLTKGLFPSKNG